MKLALVLAFGIMGAKLARRLNLPNVTGYIVEIGRASCRERV